MNVAQYYTDGVNLRGQLDARMHLRKKVEEWMQAQGWGFPKMPEEKYLAMLGRHVATSRYEDIVFMLMARRAGLRPMWMEYTADQLVCVSPFKRGLLKYQTCSGRGRNGGYKTKSVKLASIENWKSRPIRDVVISTSRKRVVDHHHELQDRMLGNPLRMDFSYWLAKIGKARRYYTAYLAMFVAHGVLFEDYHGGESGDELNGFTGQIFEPSFAEVKRIFGVQPLIVPMPWKNEFAFYPEDPNWRDHGIIPKDLLVHA